MEVDNLADTRTRIESEIEVQAYLQDLRYALSHGAQVSFQAERLVDKNRDVKYTNQFTVADLFPNENPVDALKHFWNALGAFRQEEDQNFEVRITPISM